MCHSCILLLLPFVKQLHVQHMIKKNRNKILKLMDLDESIWGNFFRRSVNPQAH